MLCSDESTIAAGLPETGVVLRRNVTKIYTENVTTSVVLIGGMERNVASEKHLSAAVCSLMGCRDTADRRGASQNKQGSGLFSSGQRWFSQMSFITGEISPQTIDDYAFSG